MTSGAPGLGRARRPSRRASTQRLLVDAALRLFAERGYVGVRVEDIAREAGVSRATFYKHFTERDEILAELFARLLRSDAPPPAPVGDDVAARVLSVLTAAAEQMVEQEVLARFVYSLPIRHDAILPGGAAEPVAFQGVRDEIEAGQAAGTVRDDLPVEHLLGMLGRAFEAAMRDWAEGRVDDPAERLGEMVSIVFHGIVVRPPPGPA